MRRASFKLLIKSTIILTLFIILTVIITYTSSWRHELQRRLSPRHILNQNGKKDWHDWPAIHTDCQRQGLGEQGKAAQLDNVDRAQEAELIRVHGLNALLSNAISVNRSVPDVRDNSCLHQQYLSKLPSVSIVITFHNELLSTFTRTLHSIINRTPPELLKEIILVDDFGDAEFFAILKKYATEHFANKVQFIRMPERSGLIRARLAGARKITAEVLIILEPHIEVNYNWLPPLLEPIALNKRTVVCPIIDGIFPQNLQYEPSTPAQGGFDWNLLYSETGIQPKDIVGKTKPYKNPVMNGGLFAIAIDFFWELGGYDEGLEIWGGEQFELSFKIWMCGGQLLNAPCSRIGHHFRGNLNKGPGVENQQYLSRNKKRVAEVWMDEFKENFYAREGGTRNIDAGDLTLQKALRDHLQCKSFKWYLNEIAQNVLKEWPPVEPLEYASGAIQSLAVTNLCIDTFNDGFPGLYECASNLTAPPYSQLFLLRFSRDLRWRSSATCFDVPEYSVNGRVIFYGCHNLGKNQFWYYDRNNKWLVNGPEGKYCLDSSPSNKTIFINICNKDNINMKWSFGNVNNTALDEFDKYIKF